MIATGTSVHFDIYFFISAAKVEMFAEQQKIVKNKTAT